MAAHRPLAFRNGFVYHIFNRGVERRTIFLTTKERERFVSLIEYYRFEHVQKSFSLYLKLSLSERESFRRSLEKTPIAVEILAYCLMPNHFHLILRQTAEGGIHNFLSNVANGYAKYFNKRHHRVGPLFQGPFKAVLVETDEQLIHLSRYVHINPVVSGVIENLQLNTYPWSSLPIYLRNATSSFVITQPVLSHFRTIDAYREFVTDQVAYAKEIEKIKHLSLEDV